MTSTYPPFSFFICPNYRIMYGQVETINQIVNAYFQITFSEWCWVFMDGFWTCCMAFTLPLAKPADRLAHTRPTSSILGWQTLSSALGVLSLNFVFTVLGRLGSPPSHPRNIRNHQFFLLFFVSLPVAQPLLSCRTKIGINAENGQTLTSAM